MRVLIVLGVSAIVSAGDRSSRDWPMFRGDPALAGRVDLEEPLKSPVRLWKFQAGDAIESSAAIVDGRVYIGSMDGTFYVLNLDDGKIVWKKQFEGGITVTPLVVGDVVYLGDGLGIFRALATRDGKSIWQYDTQSEIHSSANTDGKHVLFGACDSRLHCLDASTGKAVWTFQTEGQVYSTPTIIEGKTFVSGCDEIFRVIDIATGKETVALEMGGYTSASPAALGGRVFVGTFSCEVLAIDWRAGKKVWSFENPDRTFPYHATCAVTEDRIIAAGRDKMVHCLQARSGEVLWKFRSRSRFDSSPVIAGHHVFIGGGDGKLYRFDLKTGPESMWSFTVGAPIIGSASVAAGKLVIADVDGVVHCFRIAGKESKSTKK